MTMGSWRAPPPLAPFIEQTSCWFSSGPSQQDLARGRARDQRGFGERRREVCSCSAAAFQGIKHHLPPIMRFPQILSVPAKPAGPDLAGKRSSLNITQMLAQGKKRNKLSIMHCHRFRNSGECSQQRSQHQSRFLKEVLDVITAFIF